MNMFHLFPQIKFAIKFISGAKKLPTKREMHEDNQKQHRILSNKGDPKNNMHRLSSDGAYYDYLNQLSDAADIENYPKVLRSIFEYAAMMSRRNFNEYRKYNYLLVKCMRNDIAIFVSNPMFRFKYTFQIATISISQKCLNFIYTKITYTLILRS